MASSIESDTIEGQSIRDRLLFLTSCIAIVATAMTFGIRADIMESLAVQFQLSHEQVGWIASTAFWGFTLSMLAGGPFCDRFGMKLLIGIAFVCHAVGLVLTVGATGLQMLFWGTLAIGLGNGFIESALNPLMTSLYPNQKTERLNRLHMWFPGGIAIGGLVSIVCTSLALSWRMKVLTIALPTMAYAVLFSFLKLPPTECARAVVPPRVMYRQALRPGFLFLLLCILLTAATELGPSQWVPSILTRTSGFSGTFILIGIAVIEAAGRRFVGHFIRRMSPVLLLILCTLFSAVGLYGLGASTARWSVTLAAIVYAIGICYCWPTMYGITSERFPLGGAFLLALIGSTGMLSDAIVVPLIGRLYDQLGAGLALRWFAVFPCLAAFCFFCIWLYDRRHGGYRVVRIAQENEAPFSNVSP